MASEYFGRFLRSNKCSDCGKIKIKGLIIDWIDKSPWCVDCFKELLEDRRRAEVENG